MSWFRRPKPKTTNPLLGLWRIDHADVAALETLGDVSVEFDDAGNLNYLIHSAAKVEVIIMTYRIDGPTIISDQPSNPNPQRTAFELASDGALILSFGGERSRFVRA